MMTNVDDFWERERERERKQQQQPEIKNNRGKNIFFIIRITIKRIFQIFISLLWLRKKEWNKYIYGFVLEMTNIDE